MKFYIHRGPIYLGYRSNHVPSGYPGYQPRYTFVLNSTAHISNLSMFGQQVLSVYMQNMSKIKRWEI